MDETIKILDCTLRDGGYYNDWDFSPEVVENYLYAVANAKIDYVELGLRNFEKNGFYGAFAYTTERYLDSIELPEGPTYGVMVDAKTILSASHGIKLAVDELFVSRSRSKIGLVRIAAHFNEIESSGEIASLLKKKGYIVGLNMMQAGGKPSEMIRNKAAIVASWGAVDILYFADSLGNMDSAEVRRIYSAIQASWSGPIGIHTHNNMSRALENTITAMEAGATWLDVTVTGMGRGAGNAQTENLLAILDDSSTRYRPDSIYELVIKFFADMQKNYGWGASLPYFLGAKNNIHPTYIQNLVSSDVYGKHEVIEAIKYLSNMEGTSSYNSDLLTTAISFSSSHNEVGGTTDLVNRFDGRDVLIVANGPSTTRYLKEIESFIKHNNPIVLAVNVFTALSEESIDYYCVTHNSKFVSQSKYYTELDKPIIAPLHRFSGTEKDLLTGSGRKVIDYGFAVKSSVFTIQPTFCEAPFDVTFAYAIGVATIGGAKSIDVVGIDGYQSNDQRQLEMIEICNLFKEANSKLEISALTPTTYPVLQKSIFAP
ncbi:MAG: pyruvate carboxyltransferase [Oceanospirillaceae bacterium]|nr:pyruvate carboxyltransferase [Oceanospirillaceae bacterium]